MSRRRPERQAEARERDEARTTLTPQGQLAVLDLRLGKSVGAQQERLRLLREIEKREETVMAKSKVKSKVKASPKAKSSERSGRKKAKARRNADRERTSRGGHK